MNVFEFVNAINSKGKKDIISSADDPIEVEKQYVPYIVNKALSYFPDTIMYANTINRRGHLPHKLQFHYLLNTIRAGRRYAKWIKKEDSEELQLVKEYYQFNDEKARQALPLLSQSQLSIIRTTLTHGVKDEHSRAVDRGETDERR